MFRVFSFAALLSFAVSASALPPQKSFDEIVKQADSARIADRMTEAIGLYREGVSLRPSWTEGWLWLGNLLYDEDRFPEAQASFTRFLTLAPKPGPALALRGLCEFENRDFDRAGQDLQTWAHGDFHGSTDLTEVAAFHWALLLTRQHRFDEALYVLADRAQRGGESPVLVEAMGLASLRIPNLPEDYSPELREPVWLAGKAAFYVSLHDFARGQEYSHRLLAAYGQQPNVHYLQGTLLKFQLEPAEAAKEFRKELDISPQHVPAMLELAQFDIDNSNLTEALSLARHAAEIEPTNPDRIIFSAARCLRPDRRKKARRNWSRRSISRRESSAIHSHLAAAYRN